MTAAVLGTGGVELSGALACSMAVMAYHKHDYKIMWISILSSIVYAAFVMLGIMQAKNTAAFGGAVGISLIAYLMQGVWQSYNNKLRVAQAETDMQISLISAQTRLTNAETRKAKSGAKNTVNTREQSQSIVRLPDAKIAEIGECWKSYPDATYREIAAMVGVSPITAGKYKPEDSER